MASNTENTEGKLAAYIDGRLDPAERAQIEQYLAANPDHRKLLADMVAQRDALRSLPRDKAPADIYDAIQAQLERSILLDDSGQATPAPVRHSRRSQLFAAAAILMLSFGLAGVLYFALPSSQPHATEVASVTDERPATSAPLADAEADNVAVANRTNLPAAATQDHTTFAAAGTEMRIAAAAPSISLNADTLSNVAPSSPTFELLSDTLEFKELAKQIAPAGPAAQDRLVVLVSTDNPSQASQQVATYLESNKIQWETVQASPPTHYFYAREDTRLARTNDAAPSTPAFEAKENLGLSTGRIAGDAGAAADQGRSPAGSAAAESVARDDQPAAGVLGMDGILLKSLPDQRQQPAVSLDFSQPTTDAAPAQQRVAQNQLDRVDQSRRLIIARGMTRQQAAQLTDALSADQGISQRARLLIETPARKLVAAHKQFAPADAKLKLSATPATRPTTDLATAAVPYDDDPATPGLSGQAVTLGLPPSEMKKTEAAYGVASAPGAVPGSAATQPTTLPAGTLATTSPAHPPEDAVDVVILVEDGPAMPTSVPATTTAAPASQEAPTTTESPALD